MTNEYRDRDEQNFREMTNDGTGVADNLYNLDTDEYFLKIMNDLNQTDRLVNDAVTNLVVNFRYISELSKSHHNMVLAIEKMSIPKENKPVLELLHQQMEIADKIERELESAMIALQFGDLVSQLLAHATSQIEFFKTALQRINSSSTVSETEKHFHGIHEKISEAVQLAESKRIRKPVIQHEMQKGEIELF